MIRVCSLFIAAVLLLSSLKAEPSLRGIIRLKTTTLFAVCDEASGRSVWASLGEATEFGKLTEFDEQCQTLAITASDGHVLKLPMAAAVIRELVAPAGAGRAPSVFLSPELKAKLAAQGKNEASVLQDAVADIEREMATSKDPADRLFLQEIIAGLKAGDLRIISTEGKPLRREDHPEMSQEKFDRINKLMQMTPEQVQALIDTGTDPNKQANPAK
ncbi:MAG TPA: hypothetical protein VK163_16580 [Opitutaceae bacterium]|nr:hypothetical protein [Opitutaceae bacterium]